MRNKVNPVNPVTLVKGLIKIQSISYNVYMLLKQIEKKRNKIMLNKRKLQDQ